MGMRGTWVWLSIAAIGAGVGIGALSLRSRREPPPLPVNRGAAVVASTEITLNGTIRPQHVTGVAAQVNGNVEALMADVGDEVFAGQVLARIGAGGLESEREAAARSVEYAQEQVARAEAAITSAKLESSRAAADEQRAQMAVDRADKTYSRQKTLHAAGATPRLTYEKAEADYQSAQQELTVMQKAATAAEESVQSSIERLESAKKVLADKSRQLETAQGAFEAAEVRAPVDGLVVGRKGEVGKPAEEAGDQLFQIATDTYALEVDVEPQPAALKRIQPGQAALVVILDLQTGGLPATVKAIKDNVVTVEFTSTMPAIRPGMRADVRLKLE